MAAVTALLSKTRYVGLLDTTALKLMEHTFSNTRL